MGRRLTSLGVKSGDWRKCHVPTREEQGQSSLTHVETHGAATAGGASSNG